MSLPEGYQTRILLSLRKKLKARSDDMFAMWVEDAIVEADYYVSPNVDITATTVNTIDELNALNVPGGSTVAFERGYTYYGSLSIIVGGTVETPTTYTAYGSGNLPIISGITEVTGFTEVETGKWSKSVGTDAINFIVIDNYVYQMARFPLTTKDGYQFDSVSGNDLTDSYFTGKDFTGKTLVLQSTPWSLRFSQILSNTGDTVTVDDSHGASTHTEFFVQNDETLMTDDYMWVHDGSDLIIKHSDINTTTVEIPTVETGVVYNASSGYIKMQYLEFRGYNEFAIEMLNGGSLEVDGCVFTKCGQAVYSATATPEAFVFNGSSVSDMMVDGLHVFGRPNANTITNNTFTNIGYEGLGSQVIDHRYTAIECGSNSYSYVRGNTINHVLYNGISCPAMNGEQYYGYNSIKNTNNVLIDGAALYVPSGNATYIALAEYNIIDNGERGLYIDNPNSYVSLENNTVTNCVYSGVYLHENDYISVLNNTFYANEKNIYVQVQSGSTQLPTNINISNNITYTKQQYDYAFQYSLASVVAASSDWSDIGFGTLANNSHIGWSDDLMYWLVGGNGIPGMTKYTLSGLQAKGYDTVSTLQIVTSPEIIINETLSETTINFPGETKTDAKGNVYTNSITLQPFTSVVFVD